MIANCSSDEHGKARGGQAGDQTGNEWRIRTWYSSPWLCVLRYPTESIRNMIADFARDSANNNNIGYDQGNRTSFWTELTKVNYQPSKIKTKCETDCSASTSAIVKAIGYIKGIDKLKNISKDNWTGSMRSAFKSAGFTVLTDSKYLTSDKYLLPGDILLNDTKHVCINLDYGSAVKPTSTMPTPKGYSGGFPILPPNLKKGSSGLQVQRLQKFLNWYFDNKVIDNKALVVDGEFGTITRQAVFKFQQKVFYNNVTEWDGIFGAKSLAKAKGVKK